MDPTDADVFVSLLRFDARQIPMPTATFGVPSRTVLAEPVVVAMLVSQCARRGTPATLAPWMVLGRPSRYRPCRP